MTIALALPHEGEAFTAAGCTFRILDDGGPTAGRIGLAECSLVPGWDGRRSTSTASTTRRFMS